MTTADNSVRKLSHFSIEGPGFERKPFMEFLQDVSFKTLMEESMDIEVAALREECGAMMESVYLNFKKDALNCMCQMEARYKASLHVAFANAITKYETPMSPRGSSVNQELSEQENLDRPNLEQSEVATSSEFPPGSLGGGGGVHDSVTDFRPSNIVVEQTRCAANLVDAAVSPINIVPDANIADTTSNGSHTPAPAGTSDTAEPVVQASQPSLTISDSATNVNPASMVQTSNQSISAILNTIPPMPIAPKNRPPPILERTETPKAILKFQATGLKVMKEVQEKKMSKQMPKTLADVVSQAQNRAKLAKSAGRSSMRLSYRNLVAAITGVEEEEGNRESGVGSRPALDRKYSMSRPDQAGKMEKRREKQMKKKSLRLSQGSTSGPLVPLPHVDELFRSNTGSDIDNASDYDRTSNAVAAMLEASTWVEKAFNSLDVWMHAMVMDEHSRWRRTWDTILFSFLVFCSFSIPYKLSFIYPEEDKTNFTKISESITDAVFAVDVCMNFFTAYRDTEGIIQWDLDLIALNYVKSWLLNDVICAIPWDHLVGVFTDQSWPAFLRLLRLLTLMKLQLRLKNMERHLNNPGALRLFRLSFLAAVAVHWCACITNVVADHAAEPSLWLGVTDYENKDNTMRYSSMVYWVSSTMLGERSTPQDLASVLVTIAVFWFGLMLYFSIFSSLITVLVNMNRPLIEFNQSMDKRLSYMRKLQVPMGLRLKIVDYFEDLYSATKGVDPQMFVQELPRHLRQELALFLNKKLLSSCNSIFKNCALPFLTALMMRLEVAVCLEGDLLCAEGDIGDEMFFIISGQLDIFKQGVGKVGELHDGDFFGEGIMNEDHGRRNASVQAKKACTMYTLNKKCFKELQASFPEDSEIFFLVNSERKEANTVVRTDEIVRRNSLDSNSVKGNTPQLGRKLSDGLKTQASKSGTAINSREWSNE